MNPPTETLAQLLGGRRAAIDATLGPAAFGVAYAVSGHSVWIAVLAACVVSLLVAIWRLGKGDKPRAVLLGLLGVAVAAYITLQTGRAEDFFILRILINLMSGLAWAISIVFRWPLLGVVVGGVLGQLRVWRRDPGLMRAYSRASWLWVAMYVFRVLVWVPLWWFGWTEALSFATVALATPLLLLCLTASWWVIKRTLPEGHPGLRHPVVSDAGAGQLDQQPL